MEEKKFLEAGITELGTVNGEYNGKFMTMKIRYGNSIFPTVKKDGKEEFVHLKKEKYEEMLDAFLKSEAGKNYKRPPKEEIEKASLFVLNKEKEYLKSKGYAEPEKEEKREPEKLEPVKTSEKPKKGAKTKEKAAEEAADDYATVLLEEPMAPAKKKSPTLTNKKTGEIISIKKTLFKIGCSQSCDLVIEQDAKSHTISRQHASIITKNDDSLYITDKSSNGTFICAKKNGEYIRLPKDHEVELKNGTYIKFATEEFLYKEV